MMLSLNQYVLRRAINGAVYVWLPIIKMTQSSFLEEKYLWLKSAVVWMVGKKKSFPQVPRRGVNYLRTWNAGYIIALQ